MCYNEAPSLLERERRAFEFDRTSASFPKIHPCHSYSNCKLSDQGVDSVVTTAASQPWLGLPVSLRGPVKQWAAHLKHGVKCSFPQNLPQIPWKVPLGIRQERRDIFHGTLLPSVLLQDREGWSTQGQSSHTANVQLLSTSSFPSFTWPQQFSKSWIPVGVCIAQTWRRKPFPSHHQDNHVWGQPYTFPKPSTHSIFLSRPKCIIQYQRALHVPPQTFPTSWYSSSSCHSCPTNHSLAATLTLQALFLCSSSVHPAQLITIPMHLSLSTETIPLVSDLLPYFSFLSSTGPNVPVQFAL